MTRALFAGFALSAVAFAAPAPTFYKDVLPTVLENNCQELPPTSASSWTDVLHVVRQHLPSVGESY